MKDGHPTLREVLEDPAVLGSRDAIPLEEIRGCLRKKWGLRRDLIGVQLLSAFGAWFAAVFFLFFFENVGLFPREEWNGGMGVVLLVFGAFLSRVDSKSVFLSQGSLALGLTGSALLWFTVYDLLPDHQLEGMALSQLLVCLIFYPLSRSFSFRVFAPIALSVLALFWVWGEKMEWAFHALVALEAFLFGVLWLGRWQKPALLPLAYASALMLPISLLFVEMRVNELLWGKMVIDFRPSALLISLGLLWVYARFAGSRSLMKKPEFVIAVLGTLALGAVSTPGLLGAMGLLVVGRGLGVRYLVVLAYLFFPVFLWTYYASIQVDLATKSWILMASGLLLILIQQLLHWVEVWGESGSEKGSEGVEA